MDLFSSWIMMMHDNVAIKALDINQTEISLSILICFLPENAWLFSTGH